MVPVMPGEDLCNVVSNPRLCSTLQREREHCGTLLDQRVTDSSLVCSTDSVAVQQ